MSNLGSQWLAVWQRSAAGAAATPSGGTSALPTVVAPRVSTTAAQVFGLSTQSAAPTTIPATTGALAMLGGQGAVAGQKAAPADTGGLFGDIGGSIVKAVTPYTKRGFLIAAGFGLILVGAVMFAMSFNQVREGITSAASTALKVAPLVA